MAQQAELPARRGPAALQAVHEVALHGHAIGGVVQVEPEAEGEADLAVAHAVVAHHVVQPRSPGLEHAGVLRVEVGVRQVIVLDHVVARVDELVGVLAGDRHAVDAATDDRARARSLDADRVARRVVDAVVRHRALPGGEELDAGAVADAPPGVMDQVVDDPVAAACEPAGQPGRVGLDAGVADVVAASSRPP